MIARFVLLLGEATLPGTDGLPPAGQGTTHMQPALIGVAALAVVIVAFLGIDFYRQKRVERMERDKLTRFRQRRLAETEKKTPLQPSD
jgi:hypothetical protein